MILKAVVEYVCLTVADVYVVPFVVGAAIGDPATVEDACVTVNPVEFVAFNV